MALRVRGMVAVVVAVVLGVAGCGRPFGGRVVYPGDYPYYRSVAELLDTADLVVEVTVAEPRVGKLYQSGADPAASPPEADSGVVVTIYQATVAKVHKGSASTGDVIEVQQPGQYEVGPAGDYRPVGDNPLTVTAEDLTP